jgi:hypothetical protein
MCAYDDRLHTSRVDPWMHLQDTMSSLLDEVLEQYMENNACDNFMGANF